MSSDTSLLDDSLCNSSLNNSELLDLSVKEFFLIIYYPDSDPGNEFEILNEKELAMDSWNILERGASVMIKFGNAKLQGYVVTVSDDLNYLSANFKSITEEFLDSLKRSGLEYLKIKRLQSDQIPINLSETNKSKESKKVIDKEIQTNEIENTSARDFLELKKKYDDLKQELNHFRNLFTDVKENLEQTACKINSFNSASTIEDGSSINKHLYTKNGQPNINNINRQPLSGINNINRGGSDKENNQENSLNMMVEIGSKGTKVHKKIFDCVKWSNYSAATRKLLITLFPRQTLATHSLTGKPSPAFLTSDKQTKDKLNPTIISDIIEIIKKKCMVSESLVRNVITTKCADENKLYRKRLEKRLSEENMTDTKKLKTT